VENIRNAFKALLAVQQALDHHYRLMTCQVAGQGLRD